jgi:hypothetical protein
MQINSKRRAGRSRHATLLALALALLTVGPFTVLAEEYQPARTADGKPDLNGIWQALGTAHWDIEAHMARQGPVVELGAVGAIPAGLGVIVEGRIPYQPWAAIQKQKNLANWVKLDPVIKCYRPGVPRATYLPFPFQIIQDSKHILIAYEFAETSRVIYIDRPDFDPPIETWMGHSRAHWENDTLVVDVSGHLADTWFDSSGNFHSDQLHVVERYTVKSPYHLEYEATIEDPKVLTQPFKISMPLYRRIEANAQLLEFKCMEFAEELMYGHLNKKQAQQEE